MTVSRQETPRPLLTPGEILQLPPDDAVVLVSGAPPIRARKLRYFMDRNFLERRLAAPKVAAGHRIDAPPARPDDWSGPPRGTDERLDRPWSELVMAGAPDEDPPRTREVVPHLGEDDRARDLPLVAGHDPDPAPGGPEAPQPDDAMADLFSLAAEAQGRRRQMLRTAFGSRVDRSADGSGDTPFGAPPTRDVGGALGNGDARRRPIIEHGRLAAVCPPLGE